jgi:hypothetical protein
MFLIASYGSRPLPHVLLPLAQLKAPAEEFPPPRVPVVHLAVVFLAALHASSVSCPNLASPSSFWCSGVCAKTSSLFPR